MSIEELVKEVRQMRSEIEALRQEIKQSPPLPAPPTIPGWLVDPALLPPGQISGVWCSAAQSQPGIHKPSFGEMLR